MLRALLCALLARLGGGVIGAPGVQVLARVKRRGTPCNPTNASADGGQSSGFGKFEEARAALAAP